MIEGENFDSRGALSLGLGGRGRQRYWFWVTLSSPCNPIWSGDGENEWLGVLAIENPDFFFHSKGAVHERPAISSEHPPYYGYHMLSDGTLTLFYNHLAMIVTRDGTIYVTILYPFILLRINGYRLIKVLEVHWLYWKTWQERMREMTGCFIESLIWWLLSAEGGIRLR